MNRRLLAPRWLAAHLAVLTAVLVCALLGWWQLDRAREQHALSLKPATNATAAPVELSSLVPAGGRPPAGTVGRPVLADGVYDVESQVLVPADATDGAAGYVVVTPLVGTGPAVVVVRGWVPSAADGGEPVVPAPRAGQVTVTGTLGAGDGPPEFGAPLPSGQLGSVHLPSLLNLLPYDIYDVVVTRTAESPAPAEALAAPPSATGRSDGDWPLQNLFYAVEWWIFGLAAVAMWVSAVHRREPSPGPARVTQGVEQPAGGPPRR